MGELREWIVESYQSVYGVVNLKIFRLGEADITLWSLVYLLLASFVLIRAAGVIRDWIATKILARTKLQPNARTAMATGAQYFIVFLGFVIILQSAGIDLSAITVMIGALGIGLSFGLQTITTNFVSGLILLFERRVRVGDLVKVGDVVGTVRDVSLRATTVITTDNVAVLIPNSEFITSKVQNWTLSDNWIKFAFPYAVESTDDPETIRQEIHGVLSRYKEGELQPSVLFADLSGKQLKFNIRIRQRSSDISEDLRSELLLLLSQHFRLRAMEDEQERDDQSKEDSSKDDSSKDESSKDDASQTAQASKQKRSAA